MANISLEIDDYFMHLEEKRLNSFQNWPYEAEHECTAAKLAAAGWYHIPTDQEPDAVRCFVCLKELDGWEPNDDPWKEHMKHSPQCPFLKLPKTSGKMTVEQLLNLEIKRWSLKMRKILDARIEEYKIQADAVRDAMKNLVDS
ncbi:baculoviral IAP repeat-containing protein 5.2-like [Haliotis asinina]|uniref:baculoviral IAP repeat-containing protein 5.2-like n=1 Tax=Haliotis asinina TaxID=109174 RepID=UPI0035326097